VAYSLANNNTLEQHSHAVLYCVNTLIHQTKGTTATVFDVGARYGPHPSWSKLFNIGLCRIHAFEPEPKEFQSLEDRYRDNERYTINNIGPGDSGTIGSLNIQCHEGQASFLVPNLDSNWFKVVRPNDGITTGRKDGVEIIRAEEYIERC